jgi:hypothetical protein
MLLTLVVGGDFAGTQYLGLLPAISGNDGSTGFIPSDGFSAVLDRFNLLDGAPRKAIKTALSAVEKILDGLGDIFDLIKQLTGDEVTVRFDWNPEISSWGFDGSSNYNKSSKKWERKDSSNKMVEAHPLFRAHDKKGFSVGVEAKVKKSDPTDAKISVFAGLKHFDLVLIAPASFIELNFEKIEFTVDSKAKMNVDVLLSDIKFVGPLSFVEVLRDFIPLDGFSDPPYLDITPKGIEAGFDMSLPVIQCGQFALSNVSLGAAFTVPFIGQPLGVRFFFCTREQPFSLTVYAIGGGGFFGITIDPHGVQVLEAAFEFGADLQVDFVVAKGGVTVMAGIYFRMEQDKASLTGYFRLEGHVSVMKIVSISIKVYLSLEFVFQTCKVTGKAEFSIEISLFIFSFSATLSIERSFAGSNGDPTLRQMLGYDPEVELEQELAKINADTNYAWREYVAAYV